MSVLRVLALAASRARRDALLLPLVALVSAAPLAANVEISETVLFSPVDRQRLSFCKSNDGSEFPDAEINNVSYFGLEITPNFFFFSPTKHLDVGLGLTVGFSVIAHELTDFPTEPSERYGSYVFAAAGLALRWNFNERHSLSLTPALQYNIKDVNANPLFAMYALAGLADYDALYESRYRSLAVKCSYKRWLLNAGCFHLGLDGGCNILVPLDGAFSILYGARDYVSYSVDGGFGLQLFLGMSVNFGDRSVEKPAR